MTRFINEEFYRHYADPWLMDKLWAQGWRHFGGYFFRYSIAHYDGGAQTVVPLRIKLSEFEPSRSQKRALSRNQDLKVVIRPSIIDDFRRQLFNRHKQRFDHNVPDSINDFMSSLPASLPCTNKEIDVFAGDRLIGISFLDIGQTSTSSVYAMFEPEESKRSLGIFMILQAIQYSRELGCSFYYPGYAYRGPSFYDYKKNFAGLESYDWQKGWQTYNFETKEAKEE